MVTIELVRYSLIATVIAVLVLGVTLIFTSRPRGPRYAACGRCGYDVGGTLGSSATCSECGTPLRVAGVRTRASQRRNVATVVLGIILSVLGVAGLAGIATGRLTGVAINQSRWPVVNGPFPPVPLIGVTPPQGSPAWPSVETVVPRVSYEDPMLTEIEVPPDAPTGSVKIAELSRVEMLELLGEVTRLRKYGANDEKTAKRLKRSFDALMTAIKQGVPTRTMQPDAPSIEVSGDTLRAMVERQRLHAETGRTPTSHPAEGGDEAADGEEEVVLGLHRQELEAVAPFLARVTGKQVRVHEKLRWHRISLMTEDRMPESNAVRLILEKLKADGLDIRESETAIDIGPGSEP